MNIRLGLSLLVAAALSACGGGSSTVAGGVGTGGTGITWGTVTGFGSVIVDGVEYDDTQASIQQGHASGLDQDTIAQIGQQVQVTHDGQGHASAIRVTPQLMGPTSVVGTTALSVMGQTVTMDATQTVISDAPQAGDWVRVFGQWTSDSTGQAQLSATRVERVQPTDTSRVLISGAVSTWDSTTSRVDLSNGWVVQVPDVNALNLSTGASVAFWIDANTWTQAQVTALQADSHPPTFQDGDELTLEAHPSREDDGSEHLLGIPLPSDVGELNTESRTRVTLKRIQGQWTLAQAPSTTPNLANVRISGWTQGTDWNASPLQFNLRNTALRVPSDVLAASTCASYGTSQVLITADAVRGDSPLQVTRLTCSGEIQSKDVADTVATVIAYDPATNEVTLDLDGEQQTVAWPDQSKRPDDLNAIINQPMHVAMRRDEHGHLQPIRISPKTH